MKRIVVFTTPWLCWLASGILFGVAFLHPWLSWTSIIAAVLFLHAIFISPRPRTVFWGSVLAGTLKSAGGLAWVWHTYPLIWLGIPPGVPQLMLIGGYWLFFSVAVGSALAVCGGGMYFLVRRNRMFIVAFPFLFVAAEVLGSLAASLYALGPGSTANINFSFGYFGYAVAQMPGMLPFAVFGGVYALSFLGALLALLIYGTVRPIGTYRIMATAFACFLILAVLSAVSVYGREVGLAGHHIIAVETHFDAELFTKQSGYEIKQTEIIRAVESALSFRPDILVLPEDSRFVSAFQSTEAALTFIENRSVNNEVILIDSGRMTDMHDVTVLRAHVFDTKRDSVHTIDKQYLVPQGEYIPYIASALLRVFGKEEFLATMNRNQSYRPGAHIDALPSGIPGILFCSESVIPSGVRTIVRKGTVPLIVHPVSHSWFHDPVLLTHQLHTMLAVHAVWNKTPILQAGNMTESRIYYPNGSTERGERIASDGRWELYVYK